MPRRCAACANQKVFPDTVCELFNRCVLFNGRLLVQRVRSSAQPAHAAHYQQVPCLTGTRFSCFGSLSRLRRWSVELGVLAALQLLTACCSLCVLLLYMRLDAGRKKFVGNRLGLFSACVTLDLVFGAAATVAAMNNQIWCAAAVAAAARCIQIDQID